MGIYPESKVVPGKLQTHEFLIRPLRASDVEADYDALMESREMLRIWDQSEWPADDFTLEDNRADLQDHEEDHAARQSFTFTVMDPADRTCLGCIYLHELKSVLQAHGVGTDALQKVGAMDVYVTFWVRASRLKDGLDQKLLTRLTKWFDESWAFDRVAWGANTADTHQQQLFFNAGLIEKWRLPIGDSQECYLLFERA